MRRIVNFAVLALVLLFAQQQGYVHPLSHMLAVAAASQDSVIVTPQAAADCVECALLASGSTAVYDAAVTVLHAAWASHVAAHAYQSLAADVPGWFQSRAPPVLL